MLGDNHRAIGLVERMIQTKNAVYLVRKLKIKTHSQRPKQLNK